MELSVDKKHEKGQFFLCICKLVNLIKYVKDVLHSRKGMEPVVVSTGEAPTHLNNLRWPIKED